MASQEEKVKHSRRIRRKAAEKQKAQKSKQERVRSVIAKELIVSGKYKQRIVKDKRGKKHDLETMKFIDLVTAIQDE